MRDEEVRSYIYILKESMTQKVKSHWIYKSYRYLTIFERYFFFFAKVKILKFQRNYFYLNL